MLVQSPHASKALSHTRENISCAKWARCGVLFTCLACACASSASSLALNQQWHDWDASSLGRHCLSSSSRAYLHLSLGAVLGHHGFSCCSDCGSGIGHTGRLDELAALCACSSLGSCATTGSPYTTSDDSPFQPIRSLSSMQRDCLTTGCDDVAPTSLGDQGCAPSLEETFSRHDWFGDSGNFEPKTEVRIRDFLRHVPESRRSLSQPYNCAKFLLTSAVMHTPTSQSASGCVSCNKSSPCTVGCCGRNLSCHVCACDDYQKHTNFHF